MLTHPTLDQLKAPKLDGMAEAFAELDARDGTAGLSHAEWLGLLIDREAANRDTKRFEARMRTARLRHVGACPEDVDYRARRGLDVCLAEVTESGPLKHENLFNPLLLAQDEDPVPCQHDSPVPESITIVTGPNSGGKTRLLQGLGLAQVLAQSGLYVPSKDSQVPAIQGLFASLVQSDAPDQVEGRLGTELLRIRHLFENIRPHSMVLLDELCSGTNPSEAAEIVLMVLDLLSGLAPRAFLTTHFLDLAGRLHDSGELPLVDFLQVEMAGQRSTYQFVGGVADTSMRMLAVLVGVESPGMLPSMSQPATCRLRTLPSRTTIPPCRL